MVVGNGDISASMADAIDGSDCVIRFNFCQSYQAVEGRTDVVAVCNTGRPARAMLAERDWRESPPVRDCEALWMVRDPERFSDMRPALAKSHPELDDFCDDYTEAFEDFALSHGKSCDIIAASVHDAADAALSAFDPAPYIAPSSGLMVIMQLMTDEKFSGDHVSIAGFNHEGWDGHPFAAEARLIDSLVSSGRIRRLMPPSTSIAFQGA